MLFPAPITLYSIELGPSPAVGTRLTRLLLCSNCSTADPRNASHGAFKDEKYKQLMGDDEAGFEAVARGTWSSAKEDASFRGGFRRYGAAKLCAVMMMNELQRRLDQDNALRNISILGVDPSTMITGHQRPAPWVIRVLIFGYIMPIVGYLFPNGSVRTPQRSGSDVLEAAFGSGLGGGDGQPKALYFDGRKPLDTSAEAKDAKKCELVWKQTVRCTQLKEGETVLENWQ